jgi:hypothetical protein
MCSTVSDAVTDAITVYIVTYKATNTTENIKYLTKFFTGTSITSIIKYLPVQLDDIMLCNKWLEYEAAPLTVLEVLHGKKLITNIEQLQELFTVRNILNDVQQCNKNVNMVVIVRDDTIVRNSAKFILPTIPSQLLYFGTDEWIEPINGWTLATSHIESTYAFALSATIFELALEQVVKMHMPLYLGTLRLIQKLYPEQCFVATPNLISTESDIERNNFVPLNIGELEQSIVEENHVYIKNEYIKVKLY